MPFLIPDPIAPYRRGYATGPRLMRHSEADKAYLSAETGPNTADWNGARALMGPVEGEGEVTGCVTHVLTTCASHLSH